MKKVTLESWNTFDKLCLVSSMSKLQQTLGDQNWAAISRYTRQLNDTIGTLIEMEKRNDDWFSVKQCMAQYEHLMKISGSRKKKRNDRSDSETLESLEASLRLELKEELLETLNEIRVEYMKTKQVLDDLENDRLDDDRIMELVQECGEDNKGVDIKSKLKSMLDEKNAEYENAKLAHIFVPPHPVADIVPHPPPVETKTSSTTSPLLTSLLQSPSPLVRSTMPSTTSPTISLLLHSSPPVPMTDSTLSKLLESTPNMQSLQTVPASTSLSLPSTSSQQPTEPQNVLEDNTIVIEKIDSEKIDEGTIIVEDLTDIEHDVVASEIIIQHESPSSKNEKFDLDIMEIEGEEPEEDVLETVEEIIERVEEAIIETVGETNLSDLDQELTQSNEPISIVSSDLAQLQLEQDQTVEVIYLPQDMNSDSSSLLNNNTVIISTSPVKIDNDTVVLNDSPVKITNDTVVLDDSSGNISDDTVVISDSDMKISDETVVIDESPIIISSEAVVLKETPLNISNASVIIDDSDISCDDAVIVTDSSISDDIILEENTEKIEVQTVIIKESVGNITSDSLVLQDSQIQTIVIDDLELKDNYEESSMNPNCTDVNALEISEKTSEENADISSIKSSDSIIFDSEKIINESLDSDEALSKSPISKSTDAIPSSADEVNEIHNIKDSPNKKNYSNQDATDGSDVDNVELVQLDRSPSKFDDTQPSNNSEKMLQNDAIVTVPSVDESDKKDSSVSPDKEPINCDLPHSESLSVNPQIEESKNMESKKPNDIAIEDTSEEEFNDSSETELKIKQENVKKAVSTNKFKPLPDVSKDLENQGNNDSDDSIRIISERPHYENEITINIDDDEDDDDESSDKKQFDVHVDNKNDEDDDDYHSVESVPLSDKEDTKQEISKGISELSNHSSSTDSSMELLAKEVGGLRRNLALMTNTDKTSNAEVENRRSKFKISTEAVVSYLEKIGTNPNLKMPSASFSSSSDEDSSQSKSSPPISSSTRLKEDRFQPVVSQCYVSVSPVSFAEVRSRTERGHKLVIPPEKLVQRFVGRGRMRGTKRRRTERNIEKVALINPPTYPKKSTVNTSIDSKPDSPSLSTTSSEDDRDLRAWRKSIMLVYNRLASHKFASVFSKPITENDAPGYHDIILRPMDLQSIKKNIENGVIRTTVEFQRDMLLMVQNALMYNKYDTPYYDMALEMGKDMLSEMEIMVQAIGDGVPLLSFFSEAKSKPRGRNAKTSIDDPNRSRSNISLDESRSTKRRRTSSS